MMSPATPARPLPWRALLWSTLALLFVLPLAAMAVTDEVNWGLEDFAAAAVLLSGVGIGVETALGAPRRRPLLAVAVLLTAALVWAEGAVGIF